MASAVELHRCSLEGAQQRLGDTSESRRKSLEHSEKEAVAGLPSAEPATKATPLPVRQISILLLLQSIEPLAATSIMPIAVEATRLSGVAHSEKALGYYAGFIEGFFYLVEGIFVLQYGKLSDRLGRKPVLLMGMIGMSISTSLFGLSTTFPAMVASRALCGATNGNIGIIKSAAAESLDPSNEAQGFALFSSAYAISVVVGPLIGGLFAHPERQFGKAFETSFWLAHPFALSCFAVAAIGLTGTILGALLLRETLPRLVARKYAPLPEMEEGSSEAPTPMTPTLPSSSDTPPPIPTLRELIGMSSVRRAIAAYVHLAGVDLGYVATLVLFGSTSIENGGLGMTEGQIGAFFAVAGGCAGVSQALLYARASRRYGPKRCYRVALAAMAMPFVLMPLSSLAARRGFHGLSIALLIALVPFVCVSEAGFASSFLFVQRCGPRQALGSINGLSQSCVSLIRAVGPMLASMLFAHTISHDALNGTLVYVVFGCWAIFASVVIGGSLPSSPSEESETTS